MPAEFAVDGVTTRCTRPAPSSACAMPATTRSSRLRLEKGYRAWGRELTPDYTPWRGRARLRGEARQGRFPRPRGAASPRRRSRRRGGCVSARRSRSPTRRWRMAASSILRDGEPVGEVTSAAYGPHRRRRGGARLCVVDRRRAIDAGWLDSGRFEIDIAGVRVPCAQASRRRTIRHRRARGPETALVVPAAAKRRAGTHSAAASIRG